MYVYYYCMDSVLYYTELMQYYIDSMLYCTVKRSTLQDYFCYCLHRLGAILHRLGVILHRLGAILHRQTVDAAGLFLLLMACHTGDPLLRHLCYWNVIKENLRVRDVC